MFPNAIRPMRSERAVQPQPFWNRQMWSRKKKSASGALCLRMFVHVCACCGQHVLLLRLVAGLWPLFLSMQRHPRRLNGNGMHQTIRPSEGLYVSFDLCSVTVSIVAVLAVAPRLSWMSDYPTQYPHSLHLSLSLWLCLMLYMPVSAPPFSETSALHFWPTPLQHSDGRSPPPRASNSPWTPATRQHKNH